MPMVAMTSYCTTYVPVYVACIYVRTPVRLYYDGYYRTYVALIERRTPARARGSRLTNSHIYTVKHNRVSAPERTIKQQESMSESNTSSSCLVGNSLLSSGCSPTSGKGKIDAVLDDVLNKLKLPQTDAIYSSMNLQVPSFSGIEERAEKIMSDYVIPLMSQNFYSVSAGIFIGAAVTAGLVVGTVVGAAILYGASELFPSSPLVNVLNRYTGRKRRLIRSDNKKDTRMTESQNRETDNNSSKDFISSDQRTRGDSSGDIGTPIHCQRNNQDVTRISFMEVGEARLVFIRGDVCPLRGEQPQCKSSSADQCRECLDTIGALLSERSLSWADIRKLTVYLVVDQCDVDTFCAVREEYPFPKDQAITTFLFVHRLEQEHAVVQLEAITSSVINC